jgi:lipopolysaccharide assembly outer membrane protein LptD (OstA)
MYLFLAKKIKQKRHHNLLQTQMNKFKFRLSKISCSHFFYIIALLFSFQKAQAQVTFMDSLNLQVININHADSGISFQENDITYHRLIGNVHIAHNGVNLQCDSAHFYLAANFIEAFSNVHITKSNGMNANADYIKYTGNNHTAVMKGNAQIVDGANTLQADELEYNIVRKLGNYEHGGTIHNDGTTISSDIGNYNGFSQQAHFLKNVVVTNPKYDIQSQNLKYNIKSKVVELLSPSTIISEDNHIETKSGTYNSKTGEANFTSRTSIENDEQYIEGNTLKYFENLGKAIAKGDVIVIDNKENTQLNADFVDYNKSSGFGKAIGHVVIIDSKNQNQIEANQLDFNNKTGFGKAIGHVEILDFNNNSRILSDIAEYNKNTGYGKAIGNVYIENEGGKTILTSKEVEYNKQNGYTKATKDVVIIDTTEKTTLLAGMVQYNEKSKFLLATNHPKLITITEQDSIYMRADTMMTIKQSELNKLKLIKEKDKKQPTYFFNLLKVDSTYIVDENDTSKLIIANHNVRLFSDSMQAVCDSLSYTKSEATFKLYRNPILWSKNQQSNADTIFVKTIENKLSLLNLKANALLVSETGFNGYYDQVSGGFIDAFFIENEIQKVHVNQNAESLYYVKDDSEKYVGLNKAESASMDVYFANKELNHIVMRENPKGSFPPIDKITASEKFLSTFKLLTNKKPKSKNEILND